MDVAGAAETKAEGSYVWGPLSGFGLLVAVAACAADQAAKFGLLSALQHRPIAIGPFVSLVLAWNTGISYSLFPQNGAVGPWVLFAIKVVAVVLLWAWLARVPSRLTALSLGLIIGGAVGNAVDRLHWPGVMDFVLLHIETATWNFQWYVFNLADVAIVAGVAGLLYESVWGGSAVKAP
jgi:signal peptidase II